MAESYRLQVIAHYSPDKDITIKFDLCKSRQVTSSARIAEHPMQDGTMLGDHMYREPRDMTVSGQYALLSSTQDIYTALPDGAPTSGNKLETIEWLFEDIQEKGILCTLVTYEVNGSNMNRFKIRHNMALQSITWTEELDHVDFSFHFREVMQVEPQKYVLSETQYESLPDPNYPKEVNWHNLIADGFNLSDGAENGWEIFITQVMLEAGLFNKKELEKILKKDQSFFTETIVGSILTGLFTTIVTAVALSISAGLIKMAINTAVLAGVLKAAGATATLGPTGLIVSAIIIVLAALAAGIFIAVKCLKQRNQKSRQIKNKKDAIKLLKSNGDLNGKELERYGVYLNNCLTAIKSADVRFRAFQVSTSEGDNEPRVMYIDVGGTTYKIDISLDGAFKDIKANITNLATGNFCTENNGNICITDFSQGDSFNSICDFNGEYHLYIYNPWLNEDLILAQSQGPTDFPVDVGRSKNSYIPNHTDRAKYIEEYKYNLKYYYLLLSYGELKDYVNDLADVIIDAIDNTEFK